MARQTFYVTREQRHPLYKTRMLQAGPIELDAGAARLYKRLGVQLSDEAPKKAAPKLVGESPIATATKAIEAAKPAAPKAPRKRKAKAKK